MADSINKKEHGGAQGARPRRPGRKAQPSTHTRPPQISPPIQSAAELQFEAERFIACLRGLDALAAKYLQTAPDGRVDILRRAVAPTDQAALKPLIAESDHFVATYPPGHAIWKAVLQQFSHHGSLETIPAIIYKIERCKQMHPEYRMARIAALGRRLSHVIERSPDRPFADAYRQLTASEQEIFDQAVNRREWSDLFLSPLAQKVLQASRPVTAQSRATSVAAARRKRSAAYVSRQSPASGPPTPPKKGR